MVWGGEKTLNGGQLVPEVSFQTITGDVVSLTGMLAEGPVLLAFYKASCPTCQLTLPYLDRLRGGRFRVVAVSQDSAFTAAQFNREFGVALETVIDPADGGYPASNEFAITTVPSMFAIEQDQRISWTSIGFVRRELEELGQSAGRKIFTGADIVPELKAG